MRQGQREPRPLHCPPPCWKCPKSGPKNGRPAPENELSEKNLRALALYWQIKGGRPMPVDAIVWRNCALIEMTLTHIARQKSDIQSLLMLLFAQGK
jgi:hypothetical protein